MFLFSTPTVYIRDFFALADLDEKYTNGKFSLDVQVKNGLSERTGRYFVEIKLLEDEDDLSPTVDMKQSLTLNASEEVVTHFEAVVEKPRKWTAETPYLYTLVISTWIRRGRLWRLFRVKLGFEESK